MFPALFLEANNISLTDWQLIRWQSRYVYFVTDSLFAGNNGRNIFSSSGQLSAFRKCVPQNFLKYSISVEFKCCSIKILSN